MPKKLILFSEKSSLTLSTKNSSVIIPYLYQTNIAEFLVTTTVAGYFAHIVFFNIFIFGGTLWPKRVALMDDWTGYSTANS